MQKQTTIYSAHERALFVFDVKGYSWRRWRRELFTGIPPALRPALTREVLLKFDPSQRTESLRFLAKQRDLCKEKTNWQLTASEDKLRAYCTEHSNTCKKISESNATPEEKYRKITELLHLHGLAPHDLKTEKNPEPAIKRAACQFWWRKRVRKAQGREIEKLAISWGAVSNRRALHCSNHTAQRRIEQRARNAETLKNLTLISSKGDVISMADVAEKSISNPAIRRGELMTRIAGFEALAKENNYTPLFITWTCPGRMHAQLSKSGEKNPNYDGTTPREAQAHLCKQWARTRAAASRKKLDFYGIRVCEPHHDGCPHWHMLFFVHPDHQEAFQKLLKKYALQVDSDEPGAQEVRCKTVKIDWKRGSAAGYIAKYISKNLDAYGLNTRATNAEAAGQAELWDTPRAKARRVDAWAACWGIRQFQQIGGPPVGIWRELRRIREPLPSPAIEPYRAAADSGDWRAFCSLMQEKAGVQEGAPLTLARIWSDKPGRYDDPRGWRIEGIERGHVKIFTREKTWSIVPRGTSQPHEEKMLH